jgi:hypothetical protein
MLSLMPFGFVMADHATSSSARGGVMTRIVAGNATHYGALDATLGMGTIGARDQQRRQHAAQDNRFHRCLLLIFEQNVMIMILSPFRSIGASSSAEICLELSLPFFKKAKIYPQGIAPAMGGNKDFDWECMVGWHPVSV